MTKDLITRLNEVPFFLQRDIYLQQNRTLHWQVRLPEAVLEHPK